MRRPGQLLLAALLPVSLAQSESLGAQGGTPPPDAARYASRRERAYDRLGPNLLVIQSRWTSAQASQAGFDQDASFYYFTGTDHLIGAILVLDGAGRRAEMFLPKAPPGSLVSGGPTQASCGTPRFRGRCVR